MKELNIPEKLKNKIQDFLKKLECAYGQELVSVALYGSAASSEFIDKHSNLNFLIVLKDTDCLQLHKATDIIQKFPLFEPIFMTEQYISSSTDIFPIEFLDMNENYFLLFGKDVLSAIQIDTRNLRFQCEQELKIKLLSLKNAYLRMHKDKTALRNLLFRSITSILHISRNLLRLKNKPVPYRKEDIINSLGGEFQIDSALWKKILDAKNKAVKLNNQETERIFQEFVREVEKIADCVDRL
jgi:hypothetical protein